MDFMKYQLFIGDKYGTRWMQVYRLFQFNRIFGAVCGEKRRISSGETLFYHDIENRIEVKKFDVLIGLRQVFECF